jgi:hypothetical protein
MNGAGHPSAFSQETLSVSASTTSGVCAMDLHGNGYCYTGNAGSAEVIKLTNGAPPGTVVASGCPAVHALDQIKLSISSANLLTCTNVTTPGGGPVSATDMTYLVGTLYPAVFVVSANFLIDPISTSP